jgi:hypothetical protein
MRGDTDRLDRAAMFGVVSTTGPGMSTVVRGSPTFALAMSSARKPAMGRNNAGSALAATRRQDSGGRAECSARPRGTCRAHFERRCGAPRALTARRVRRPAAGAHPCRLGPWPWTVTLAMVACQRPAPRGYPPAVVRCALCNYAQGFGFFGRMLRPTGRSGVAMGKRPASGGHQPVPAAVRRDGRSDDRGIEVRGVERSGETGVGGREVRVGKPCHRPRPGSSTDPVRRRRRYLRVEALVVRDPSAQHPRR